VRDCGAIGRRVFLHGHQIVGSLDEILVVADHQYLFDPEPTHGVDEIDVPGVQEHRRFVQDQRGHRGLAVDPLGEQPIDPTAQGEIEDGSLPARQLVGSQRLTILLEHRQPVLRSKLDTSVRVVLIEQIERLVEQYTQSLDVLLAELAAQVTVHSL